MPGADEIGPRRPGRREAGLVDDAQVGPLLRRQLGTDILEARVEELLREVEAPELSWLQQLDDRPAEPQAAATVIYEGVLRLQTVLHHHLDHLAFAARGLGGRADRRMGAAAPELPGHDPGVIALVGCEGMPHPPERVAQVAPIEFLQFHNGNDQTVGDFRKPLPGSSAQGWTWTLETRADSGPRWHARIISSTLSAGPANAASTSPSRRLRTQPSRPRACASCAVQARNQTPWTVPEIST